MSAETQALAYEDLVSSRVGLIRSLPPKPSRSSLVRSRSVPVMRSAPSPARISFTGMVVSVPRASPCCGERSTMSNVTSLGRTTPALN